MHPVMSLSLSVQITSTSMVSGGLLPPLPSIMSTTAMAIVEGLAGGSSPKALRLSSAFAPLPAKLVEKIQSGQYVEMQDLLADNMALQSQLDAMHAHPAYPLAVVARLRLRDMHSLLSAHHLLTYGRLIIRESQRHGGSGWLEYDKVFCQHAALDESVQ